MPSPLIQRRLRWLGHVHRMEVDRLPREILYGEIREGVRRVGRLLLRYKDVIKQDLRSALIDTSAWENIAKHRDTWWRRFKAGLSKAEPNARVQATCKRAARKRTRSLCTSAAPATETATPGSGYTEKHHLFEMPLLLLFMVFRVLKVMLIQMYDYHNA